MQARYALASVAVAALMLPGIASAAALTSAQAGAIIALLRAFGAPAATIAQVEGVLGVSIDTSMPLAPATPVSSAHVPVSGSFYKASNLGFDYSYNAPSFPPTNFGFGIVGVSGGKSYTQNARLTQEYNWARMGSGAAPSLYMNINAPYGSAVAGHVASPKECPVPTVGTTTEPTACAGYNYGYNAAAYAYAYAQSQGVSATLWWLDVEEANSWSLDTSVNDATIQGAIDYLNSKNIRVGIYSMTYMWNAIAGASFVPTQVVAGQQQALPLWLPIGISDQIGATNACNTKAPFVPGSQIWLVQYVANSTAVDQNYSC